MPHRSILAPTVLLTLPLLGCPPEYEPAAQSRVLTTEPLLDAGAIAVGDRLTLGLELRSEGAAPVTITDIDIEHEGDEEAFVLLPWGEDGRLVMERGSESAPSLEILQLSYRPEQEGIHRALLTIHSNDTQVDDGAWHVALRGQAMLPCATINPVWLDFGARSAGSYSTGELSVDNCGQVDLTISGFDLGDSSTFKVTTSDPVYVPAGARERIDVAWVPSNARPDGTLLTLVHNDPDHQLEVELVGNDCELSVHDSWDGDGDGWLACAGDCDDDDASVSPSAVEQSNGIDDDCDGEVDEGANPTISDDDGDGWSEDDGDCDDADPGVHPEASETIDGVDQDCDGRADDGTAHFDDDGDGYSERAGDCDDSDDSVYPGAAEAISGVDDDCDGELDEGSLAYDDDGDGWSEDDGDCNDSDPWTHPDAVEDCDALDNDCDGETDEGEACAYLAERTLDTGLGQPRGCSSAPSGRPPAGLWLLGLVGLLGITRRDIPWPMVGPGRRTGSR
jgi:MYXO-CTERM domain-containing protein